MKEIAKYVEQFSKADTKELLEFFLTEFKDEIVLATSFGAEDQVLTHMIAAIEPNTRVFTLDTGRVAEATYDVWSRTQKKYPMLIEPFSPDSSELKTLVEQIGINGFYESIDKRQECCRVRKIEPLKRALKDKKVWITGLREEQSITRSDLALVEQDETFGLLKINPLLKWSEDQIWRYIKEHDIPYNTLHDEGYPSIGCEPCTRAIESGEDIRAGRWWWEKPEHKECGLHKRGKDD